MTQQLLPESPEKTKQQVECRENKPDSARLFQGGLRPVTQLQRVLGNRRVTQLIQTKQLTPEGKIIGLQRKLTVGAADDQYEQEADRVARQVMNTSDAVVTASAERALSFGGAQNQILQTEPLAVSITPIAQRQREKENEAEEDREERKDESLQAKPFNDSVVLPDQRQMTTEENEAEPIQAKSAGSMADSFDAGTDIERQLSLSKGHGSSLPDTVRAYMEPRFGVNFSHVRAHTGSDAVQMNQNVSAQAFTHGADIYFGEGRSPTNLELTAHELTHVIQQTGSPPLQKKKRLDEIALPCPETSIQRKCPACAAEDREVKGAEPIVPQTKSIAHASPSVASNINRLQGGSMPLPKADRNFKGVSPARPPAHLTLGVDMAGRVEDTLYLQRQAGNAVEVELLRRRQSDERPVLRRDILQRDPKKKDKPVSQDIAILFSPDKDFVTLATVIAPHAKILKATSVDDLAKQLKAIKGPIGTLYFVAHMTEDGDLMFTTPGTMTYVPAESIASKIKDAAQVESIDFRGCSIAQAPAEMDKIRGALKASKATGSSCTLVTHSSDPIKIGGKAITQPKDLTDKNKAAFDTGFKEVRKLFVDAKKKCIINDSVDGYFQTGGRLIAAWVNPGSMADSEGWDDTKSICYKDLKLEKVDPTKKLPVIGPDDCKLVEVGKK